MGKNGSLDGSDFLQPEVFPPTWGGDFLHLLMSLPFLISLLGSVKSQEESRRAGLPPEGPGNFSGLDSWD